jgi:hypothetical protein
MSVSLMTSPETHSSVAAAVVKPLRQIAAVLDAMDSAHVRYCHWKSNYHIDYAITAREDVDILIAEHDFPAFVKIMLDQGFRQADSVTNREQPGVFHFLGNDSATGSLITPGYLRAIIS